MRFGKVVRYQSADSDKEEAKDQKKELGGTGRKK
jgi:hypothetical protein